MREALPPLVRAVRESGIPVLWACDPMHANTFTTASGHKTRRFDDVLGEIEGFFDAHREVGSWPGGVHLEITEDVTECLGGSEEVSETSSTTATRRSATRGSTRASRSTSRSASPS